MKEIQLSKNGKNKGKFVALVDDDDFEILNIYNWNYSKGYACSLINKQYVKMHRLIMHVTDKKLIDHVDRNGLNNQKYNLRFCTSSQNQMNKKSSGVSVYLGVNRHITKKTYYRKKTNDYHTIFCGNGYWRSSITINGKTKHIGLFKSEIEAAMAYDKLAKIHHGEFARLNFSEK